ncbi:hypothetical protein HU200_060155 [Digitaria exilis]|uniref:PGG domain-containing protein n=1 Tax=Digitaria exilis TaxID=1010633 RepID=A0A835AH73_9POAL|nr:hypothetical protein HU200_060155 [Digitaria exilis]
MSASACPSVLLLLLEAIPARAVAEVACRPISRAHQVLDENGQPGHGAGCGRQHWGGVRLAFDEMPERVASPAAPARSLVLEQLPEHWAFRPEQGGSHPRRASVRTLASAEESTRATSRIGGSGRTSDSGQDSMDNSSKRFFLVDSTKDDFEFLWKLRKYLVLLGILAVGVTYNSGLTPPGGFWNNTKDVHEAGDPALRVEFFQRLSPPYKHRPATPLLRSHYLWRYNNFVSCNSTSFVASLVTIILLLSPELSRHGIRSKAVLVCVVADLLCLIGAYAAGCCRDVATSFYVMFITVIVLICIGSLAGIFICKPVAHWLGNIKEHTMRCMGVLGRALSLKSRSNRSIKPESSHGSNGKDSAHESVAPGEDSACEPELQTSGTEVESSLEYPPEGNQNNANTEPLSNCQHPSDISPQSTNSKDLLSNVECESTDCKLVANSMESLSSTEHPSSSCQQRDDMSADRQPVSGTKEQSSADNIRANDISQEGSSEQNMSAGDSIDDGRLSLPVEASGNVESAKEHTFGYTNGDIENGGVNNSAEHENGHIDHNQEEKDQNYHGDSTEEHLDKTRTYLLLLAILAVSLTYQSGLNPPGGFWSRTENHHSAGDRILEDSDHPRFIAFFYLNAVAFVASIVIILMLLNKSMIKKHCLNYATSRQGRKLKELERRLNLLLTLAILAATVTYQAGMNPPGGVWSDDKDVRGTPGNPILQDNHRRRYDVFYYSNSVSFVSSVAITILLVNKESCDHGIKSYALRVCLVLGLLGLLIAYAAGIENNPSLSSSLLWLF